MNTKTTYPFIAIIAISIFTGYTCNHEQRTITKIKSDGSCERTVFVKSVSDTSSSFPVPTDKSWEIRLESDTEKVHSEKVYVASKRFDDVNQMKNEYKRPSKVGVDVKFEKKFRWFYTYFHYQETYKSYFPFKKIALDSFLTKEEYARYEKEDTSKALKERLDEFIMRNSFEEFYGQLIDSVKSLNDPLLPVNVFLAKKDDFINRRVDFFKDKKDNIEDQEKILGLKFRDKLERQIDGIKKSLTSKYEFMSGADGKYINEVVIPGIILNTNANTIEGNKVSWKFDENKFCYTDYIMVVESRIANLWATYATGGVLIVIVALLMLPRLKRK
jgi:hypothetical protein